MRLRRRATLLSALALVLVLWRPHPTLAGAGDAPSADAQLKYLDEDAGLVLSLDLAQLGSAHKLATELFPSEGQAIGLAGLGATALLGFYPFDPSSWSARGFDIHAPLVAQIAAVGPKNPPVRTRLILKASDQTKAKESFGRMRLANAINPTGKGGSMTTLMGGATALPSEAEMRKAFADQGVFLVANPKPLSGLIAARVDGNFIVLDLFDTKGLSFGDVIATVGRKPGSLHSRTLGAEVLSASPIAVLLRPSLFARTLERMASGVRTRERGCHAIRELLESMGADAIGIAAGIGPDALTMDVVWHRSRPMPLRSSTAAPLFGGRGLLDLQVNVSNWAALRNLHRPREAQAWDALWRRSQACGATSKALLVSSAWPEVLGLFLSELSVLDPSANAVIEALGAIQASAGRSETSTLVVAEALVGTQGAKFAKSWLRSLFGSERRNGRSTSWGLASIQPYAIDLDVGTVVGSGFRPGSRDAALSAPRKSDVTPTQSKSPLVALDANPAALAAAFADLPSPNLWRPWQRAVATVSASTNKVEFNLALHRSKIASPKKSR